MAKWLELNNSEDKEIINLDFIVSIQPYDKESKNIYEIHFYAVRDSLGVEKYNSKQERDKRFEEIKVMLIGGKSHEKAKELDEIPLEEMGLTFRPQECLYRNGIRTVGDVVNLGKFNLKRIRGFGVKSYDEIVNLLVNKYEQPLEEWT